jgi:HK97 family phage major capsid protein
MKTLSPSAMCEIRRLKGELDTLLAKPNISRADGKRADVLLGQISAIKEAGITDLDAVRARVDQIGAQISAEEQRSQAAHEKIFRSFMSGAKDEVIERELRTNHDLLAGQQSQIFTAGTEGGFTVPMSFQRNVELGLAAVDPLLDENVSTVVKSDSLVMRPLQLPGWDLSTVTAVKTTEAAQHPTDVVPAVDQKLLNAFSYRVSLGASLEFEDDVFDSAMERMAQAFGIGFSRGIGADLVNGDGSTAPQGILVGATDSGITTANSGKLVLGDFNNIFFSVNKIYRASSKCAWLMDDPTYKLVRNAVDDQHRPLINVVDDKETILGKPVYVTPSLTVSPSIGGGHIVFGDLSHYTVHVSSLYLKRRSQVLGYVEYGKALYTGIMRADAVVHDPTAGAMPPIVYATLHS